MAMLTLEQIRESLKDRRIGKVALATELRPATIIDIREGRTTNPSYETVVKLSAYLEG
jgi:hypothetical protein